MGASAAFSPLLLLLLLCRGLAARGAEGCPPSCRCPGALLDCSRRQLSRAPEPLPAWGAQL